MAMKTCCSSLCAFTDYCHVDLLLRPFFCRQTCVLLQMLKFELPDSEEGGALAAANPLASWEESVDNMMAC